VAGIAAWALAAAAVLAGVVSWNNWRKSQNEEQHGVLRSANSAKARRRIVARRQRRNLENDATATARFAKSDSSERSWHDSELDNSPRCRGFTAMRTTRKLFVADAARALGALGLPVNEERAGEWIQVIFSSK